MKRTRLCDLLGIRYPIIQGGMTWIANAELAAAVSNAGGLGVINGNAGMSIGGDEQENLRRQIRKAKALTDKPFGVNFSLGNSEVRNLIDIALKEGIRVAITAAGNPALYTSYLKEAGVVVLHLVASVRHARGAEARGVDAVIAEGYEAGGHNGADELPTLVLVPQVAGAVSIPVVAAGGIADARGLVAALALGAEGVQMGTRFIATHECIAHPDFKEAIIKAGDTGTVVIGIRQAPSRVLRSEFTEKIREIERSGGSPEELNFPVARAKARLGSLAGDLTRGEGYCGAIAGIITEVVSAREVVEGMVRGADAIIAGLK
ncbi:MAG: nitronate monooxygenase [Chloroflexota bacterium]